jgi:hypothetical protein
MKLSRKCRADLLLRVRRSWGEADINALDPRARI